VVELGETLARLRKNAGATPVALARAVGLDPLAIERIERGEMRALDRQLVLDIARALDLTDAQTDELLWSANQLPVSRSTESLRSHTVALFVDHENIYLALADLIRTLPPRIQARERAKIEPAVLAERLRTAAEQIGRVRSALAIADWERLPTGQVKEYLKQRYQVDYNLTGRNNADLKLSDAIRNVLEDDEYADVDTYVLATGDGGYLAVVDTLLRRQKRVVVWGVRGASNQLLIQNATEFRWLDEIVGIEMSEAPASELGELDGPARAGGEQAPMGEDLLSVGNEVSPLEALAVCLSRHLRVRSWSFITFVRFMKFLEDTGLFGQRREEQLAWLSHAKETRVLLETIVDDPNEPGRIARRFYLNTEHPLVRRALGIWQRVGEVIGPGGRGLAFGAAVERLTADPELRLTEVQARNWLTWMINAGFLTTEQVPHFRKEGVMVTLLRQSPGAWDSSPAPDEPEGQQRLRRVAEFAAVRLANFLDRHPTFAWIALSQLLNQLSAAPSPSAASTTALSRYDAKRAISLAEEIGLLRIEQIPNQKIGGMTTVARLNRGHPRVIELIGIRDEIIRRLAILLASRSAVPRGLLQASVAENTGLEPGEISSWIDFLVSEGIFILESTHEGASTMLRTEPRDLIVSRVLLRSAIAAEASQPAPANSG
jgi:transcriptional regulator with XRE-family HTH domain